MPIYEYQCEKCEKVHEIWHKITEEPVQKCPDCKAKMSRLISSTAFSLKGSGWYKTDYERKKTPKTGDDAGKSGKTETSDGSDKAPKEGDKSKKSEKSEKSEKSGKDTSGHGSKEPSGTKSQAA